MPTSLQAVTARLQWCGPTIAPAELPRLEIAHYGNGQATLLNASWGAEPSLVPSQLPAIARDVQVIHIAALSTAQRQWNFMQALRGPQGNRSRPRLSVGTYARLAYGDTARVRMLFEHADYFFMNANETVGLFGSVEQAATRPEAWLFVTLGADGVLAITGREVTHLPGHPATEIDPTGAGDTLCGATLAGIARGLSPIAAAEQAVILAARTVGAVGPAALLAGDVYHTPT
jgi:sugar/nucleoside kinase (ribokinase family)